jgi:hypothetical protein
MLGKVKFNLEENPPLENGVKKLVGAKKKPTRTVGAFFYNGLEVFSSPKSSIVNQVVMLDITYKN